MTEIRDVWAFCPLFSASRKQRPTLVQMQSEGDHRAWILNSYVFTRKLRYTNEK